MRTAIRPARGALAPHAPSRGDPRANRGAGRARPWAFATLALAALATSACTPTGKYVWADELPTSAASEPRDYQFAAGDLIDVRVWNQEAMSVRARVRTDGHISLPFVNDVEAAGRTPVQLASELQTRLGSFIRNPVVSVALEEARPLQVSVVGEVTRPGPHVLEPGAGVLHAIAAAGGLTEFASSDRVFVVRRGETQRIRFRYPALLRAEGRSSGFRLQSGDLVVVE